MADRCDVLHLTWSGKIGGIERQLAAIVRNTSEKNLLTQRICFLDGRGSIGDALVADGLGYSLRLQKGWHLRGLLRLAMLLRQLRPAILHIHTHALGAQIVSFLSLRRAAIRIYTEHSPRSLSFDAKFRVLYWLLRRSCSHIIALSPAMAQCFERYGIDPARVRVIPNGATIPPRADRRLDEPSTGTVGIVARLEPGKRIDLYLDVIAELRRRGIACRGLVVGDGSIRYKLVKYAKTLGIDRHVRFVGEQEDVASWLDQFDIFLMTSSVETFGLVALEAMARAVPIVAMPCQGGLSDLVERGGLLLPDRKISSAADGIARLLESTEERERLRVRGNGVIAQHNLDATVEKLQELYCELRVAI